MYTPLGLVVRMLPAMSAFEEELTKRRHANEVHSINAVVGAAVPYAVNHIYQKCGLQTGTKLKAQEERGVLGMSYDFAITTVVASHWKESKQVFAFPKELCNLLMEMDMDDFEIGWELFDHLPYQSFYLELLDNELVDGIMVRYENTPKRVILYTICGKPQKVGFEINAGIIDPRENNSFKEFFETEVYCSKADFNNPHVMLVRQMLAFLLQACMYLCAKNADIEENPVQKQIYRPATTVRNKFSEVRKWDVGMRVVKEYKDTKKNSQSEADTTSGTARRRPRQHWRKAHWHTYWVGQGRAKKELKFIAPVLVNDVDDDTPVVIHNH